MIRMRMSSSSQGPVPTLSSSARDTPKRREVSAKLLRSHDAFAASISSSAHSMPISSSERRIKMKAKNSSRCARKSCRGLGLASIQRCSFFVSVTAMALACARMDECPHVYQISKKMLGASSPMSYRALYFALLRNFFMYVMPCVVRGGRYACLSSLLPSVFFLPS